MKFIKVAMGVALALAMIGCGQDSAPAARDSGSVEAANKAKLSECGVAVASVVTSSILDAANKAKISECSVMVKTIRDAAVLYMMATGKFPRSMDDLIKEDDKDRSYLDEGARYDSWGNAYKFEVKGKKIIVVSAGPDGEFGTEDDIRSDTKL